MTETTERRQGELHFHIGAEVHCPDGECGTLDGIVIDPRNDEITHLIVKKGFLLKTDRVIPVSAVDEVGEERVEISISADRFDDYPEYDREELLVPQTWPTYETYAPDDVTAWMAPYSTVGPLVWDDVVPRAEAEVHQEVEVKEGIDTDLNVIGRGTPVRTTQGRIGEVNHVLTNAAGELTHLVVELDGSKDDYVIIGYDVVRYAHEDGVFVELGESDLQELARYAPLEM